MVKHPRTLTNRIFQDVPETDDLTHGYYVRESSGEVVILVSVEKLNKVPKSLPVPVQGVMPGCEPKSAQLVVIHRDGRYWHVDAREFTG